MNLKSYSRGIGAGIIVTAVIMGIASNKRTITDEEVINRAKELGYTQSSLLTQASASVSEEIEASISTTDSATKISIISVDENRDGVSDEDKEAVASTEVSGDGEDEELTSSDDTKSSLSDSTSDKEDTSVSDSSSEDGKSAVSDSTSEQDKSSVSNSTSEDVKTSVSNSTSDDTSEDKDEVKDPEDDKKKNHDGNSVVFSIYKGDSSVIVSRRMYEAGLVESAVEFDKYLCENGYDRYLCVGDYDIQFGLDFDTMAKIITRSKMY